MIGRYADLLEASNHSGSLGPVTDRRWLSDEERVAWLSLAGVLLKLPGALDSRLQRDAGVSLFEYFVLSGLSEAPGRTLRMSELAVFANGSLSRLSHVVKRLEERGWVRREPCRADGRFTNAVLTDAGWDKVVATAPGHLDAVRWLVVDALSPAQVRQLGVIGRRVLGRVDPDGTCPDGRPRTGRAPTTRDAT
jgi:DNA-binding MarR family transcriptional regulator